MCSRLVVTTSLEPCMAMTDSDVRRSLNIDGLQLLGCSYHSPYYTTPNHPSPHNTCHSEAHHAANMSFVYCIACKTRSYSSFSCVKNLNSNILSHLATVTKVTITAKTLTFISYSVSTLVHMKMFLKCFIVDHTIVNI